MSKTPTFKLKDAFEAIRTEVDEKVANTLDLAEKKITEQKNDLDAANSRIASLEANITSLTNIIENMLDGLPTKKD